MFDRPKLLKTLSICVLTACVAGMTANAYAVGPWDPLLDSYEYKSHGVLSMKSPTRSVYIDTDDIYYNKERIEKISKLFPGLLEDDKFVYLEEQDTYVIEHADGTITYLGAVGDATPYDVEEGYTFSSLHAKWPPEGGIAGIDILADEGRGLRNIENNPDAYSRGVTDSVTGKPSANTDGEITTTTPRDVITGTSIVNFVAPSESYNIASSQVNGNYRLSVDINGTLELPEGYYDKDIYIYNNVVNRTGNSGDTENPAISNARLSTSKMYHLHSTTSANEETDEFTTAYSKRLSDDFVRMAAYSEDGTLLGYMSERNLHEDAESSSFSTHVYDEIGNSLGYMNEKDIHTWVTAYDETGGHLGYVIDSYIHSSQSGSLYPLAIYNESHGFVGYTASAYLVADNTDPSALYTIAVYDGTHNLLGYTYSGTIHDNSTTAHYNIAVYPEGGKVGDAEPLGYTSSVFLENYSASKIYSDSNGTFLGYAARNGYLSPASGGCYTKPIYAYNAVSNTYELAGYAASCEHLSTDLVATPIYTITEPTGYYEDISASSNSVTLAGTDVVGATEYVKNIVRYRHVHSTANTTSTTTDFNDIKTNKTAVGSDGYIADSPSGCYTKEVKDAAGNVVGYMADCGYYAGETVKMELEYDTVEP